MCLTILDDKRKCFANLCDEDVLHRSCNYGSMWWMWPVRLFLYHCISSIQGIPVILGWMCTLDKSPVYHRDTQTDKEPVPIMPYFLPPKLFFFFFTVFQEKLSHIGHKEMVQDKHRQVLLLDAFWFCSHSSINKTAGQLTWLPLCNWCKWFLQFIGRCSCKKGKNTSLTFDDCPLNIELQSWNSEVRR